MSKSLVLMYADCDALDESFAPMSKTYYYTLLITIYLQVPLDKCQLCSELLCKCIHSLS